MYLSKLSLKLETYNAIRDKIINCEYSPEQILSEEFLTTEFNVSRTPIRDAISRLEQEGMLTILPKKGVSVSSLSMEAVNNIFEVRMIFEPYALEVYGVAMNHAVFLEFYDRFNATENSIPQEKYVVDDEFHHYIIHTIPNSYVHQTYRLIQAQNSRFRALSGNILETRKADTHKEHIDILTNCLKKDWVGASNAMKQHLLRAKSSSFDMILEKSLL